MTRLAIIGTAGRKDDATELASNPTLYLSRMLDAAREVIRLTGAKTLVSGGAAAADHIAVLIYLQNLQNLFLELELPERLVVKNDLLEYFDTGVRDPFQNAGGTANFYHRQFAAMFDTGWSPFMDFRKAIVSRNAKTTVTRGFHARNLVVAGKADHVLAMTFGEGRRLKDGGTAHTMAAFLARKDRGDAYHLDLNTLKLYKGATV